MKFRKSKILTGQIENRFASEPRNLVLITMLFPIVLFLLFTAALALPPTRTATMWVLSENHPVEVLTFFILLIAGVYGVRVSLRMKKSGENILYCGFYFLFSLGLILTAMEEIAWGQQFWAFQTPITLQELNMQGETTIHNIRGLHGNTEYFRFIFGLGGIIGVCFNLKKWFSKITPPVILLTWFLVIAAHATFDVINDITPIQKEFDAAISRLAELIELLIASASFLYLWFNAKKFAGNVQEESAFAGKKFSISRI